MNKQLALQIVVANPTPEINVSEVYGEFEKWRNNAEVYRLDSSKVTSAAIELITLLNIVGSVASIAGFLWYIYDTKIRPKRDRQDTSLYVAVDPKENLHWLLGKDFLDKDTFINDFTMKVEKYISTAKSGETYKRIKFEVSGDIWIKRK